MEIRAAVVGVCCQEMIEQYVHWNEDIGEWQLKCVAYTGNNMRKQSPQPEKSKVYQLDCLLLSVTDL